MEGGLGKSWNGNSGKIKDSGEDQVEDGGTKV